nr:unnamed protein product [Haemonchus contortus]
MLCPTRARFDTLLAGKKVFTAGEEFNAQRKYMFATKNGETVRKTNHDEFAMAEMTLMGNQDEIPLVSIAQRADYIRPKLYRVSFTVAMGHDKLFELPTWVSL